MRGAIVRAINIDSWYWIIGLSALVFMAYLAFLPAADALTLDEIEKLQVEQEVLQKELVTLKSDLEKNQIAINKSATSREFIKNEIRLLKIAEADDSRIFAQEIILVQETKTLKDLKLERIELLEEQSEKRQRVNSINDDVRYNVEGLDDTVVELVSSDNINLQINIDTLTAQLEIQKQVLSSIDDEIIANTIQINQYTLTRDKYQREYEVIETNSKTGWSAIASLDGAKRLADNLNEIIDVLEEQKIHLENEKKNIENERLTIISVIEDNTNMLIQNDLDKTKKKKLVGVKLSNQCIKLIRNNFPTNCPTYYDLINMDNSNQYVSGFFVTDDDGFFHRAEPNYQNSWRWYDDETEPRLILDPPKGMTERIPMITIENNFEVYFKPGDFSIDDDGLRKYNKYRHIDKCRFATLSSDIWNTALTDTIEMLRTGCKTTTIQENFIDPLPKTEIDITTSPSWHYNLWMESSKNACKTICKQY